MSASNRISSRTVLKRMAICGIALGALSLTYAPIVNAADSAGKSKDSSTQPGSSGSNDEHAGYKGSGLKIETDDSMEGRDVVLTLGYIRDCGLAVNDLRQLALNIFDECTRKHLAASDPMFSVSKTVSDASIDLNAKYHSPRPAWIFFYIATFEPILQLFRSATTTAPESQAKLIVPVSMEAGSKDGLRKLETMITSIDTQIDRLNTLLDEDPDNSVEMAKAAVSIYKTTDELQCLIGASYKQLQDCQNKGEKETVGVE